MTENCPVNYTLDDETVYIKNLTIFNDAYRIKLIKFEFSNGDRLAKGGRARSDNQEVWNFTKEEPLVGFYGYKGQ